LSGIKEKGKHSCCSDGAIVVTKGVLKIEQRHCHQAETKKKKALTLFYAAASDERVISKNIKLKQIRKTKL
jgi:hypothetical protein